VPDRTPGTGANAGAELAVSRSRHVFNAMANWPAGAVS
jgi:hypothetical protein